tara:strand:+ start:60 stop:227 length:168 start_codon:yes stop_codon:yes gene_type:complete
MNKTVIIVIIYLIGIIIGALVFGLWSENTILKSILALIWTAIFLIALLYDEKKEN